MKKVDIDDCVIFSIKKEVQILISYITEHV